MDGNQFEQPVQAGENSVEQQMAAEMETSRLIDEQQAQMAANATNVPTEKPKKAANGMLIGLIVAIVVAVCGLGFGGVMMMLRSNDAKDYEGQIAVLTAANATLTEQVLRQEEAADEITSDVVLKLLRETLVTEATEYSIEYAKVFGQYVGEEDRNAYWVKFVALGPDGVLTEYNTIIELGEDGTWAVSEPTVMYEEGVMTDYMVIDL